MIRKKIKNEQVIDFLEKNPDFFINNPNALKKINFPLKINAEYNEESKVVPFKDWIIKNLKDVQKNIIENAHHNFLTQQKIHESVIEILRIDNVKDVFVFLKDELPIKFDLEVINIVTSNKIISKKYNLIYKSEETIKQIYGKKNQLIMDAVDNQLKIFEDFGQDIYSNAIYSLGHEFFTNSSLLVFGSKDKHFLNNKAYDFILFFSNIVQEKLKQFYNE
tara:strand:- start:340 stop:999 length:660 start_codon:yes stop_codon:yes gene_type:complete